jgi:uncharacterized protein YacL (UPF0231 family)
VDSANLASMAVRIFISHSSIDSWVARQIRSHLHTLGAATVLDEDDFPAGDDFFESILNAESECSELLVLLTPWSIKREWVQIEMSWFRRARERIVAITHGMTTKTVLRHPIVGLLLDERVIMDINQLDTYFQQVAGRIKADAEGGNNG